MKIALSVATIVALLAGSIIGSYALALHALDKSQAHWCQTLALLTSGRPPAASAAQGRALLFYDQLKELERSFGCRKGTP